MNLRKRLFICVLAIVLQAKAYQLLMTYSALYVKLLMSRRLTGPSHHRLRPRRNHCSTAPFCLCQYIRKKILQWEGGELSSRDSCTRNCWTTLVYLEDFLKTVPGYLIGWRTFFVGPHVTQSWCCFIGQLAAVCPPMRPLQFCVCTKQIPVCLLQTVSTPCQMLSAWEHTGKKQLNNICILVQATLRGLLFLLTFQY